MYELRFSADDMARVRFAISPLWEVMHAVRCLIDVRQMAYHLPWFDAVRPALADLDLAPVLAVSPVRGYTPDLITPSPRHAHTTIDEQLEQVRSTPVSIVRAELAQAMAQRGGQPVTDELRELAHDPRQARHRLADTLEACWHRLVEPHWPRIRAMLDADVVHHAKVLADAGLDRLFPSLSTSVSWTQQVLRVDAGGPVMRRVELRGTGIILQPSAFCWPLTLVIADTAEIPTVAYPARGIAELWQPVETEAGKALRSLLGRTRAILLTSLREPASTTTLAHRHGYSPATVSEHLAALFGARLVTRARRGKAVLYSTTALGEALLEGQLPSDAAHTGQVPTTSIV